MNGSAEVPLWAALPVAAFLLIGAGLTLIGSLGLLRLRSFYDRIHAPTLGTSWGTAGIVTGLDDLLLGRRAGVRCCTSS